MGTLPVLWPRGDAGVAKGCTRSGIPLSASEVALRWRRYDAVVGGVSAQREGSRNVHRLARSSALCSDVMYPCEVNVAPEIMSMFAFLACVASWLSWGMA